MWVCQPPGLWTLLDRGLRFSELKNLKSRQWSVSQMVEHLLSKCMALDKKKRKKKILKSAFW
jgi:ribosomal protein S7